MEMPPKAFAQCLDASAPRSMCSIGQILIMLQHHLHHVISIPHHLSCFPLCVSSLVTETSLTPAPLPPPHSAKLHRRGWWIHSNIYGLQHSAFLAFCQLVSIFLSGLASHRTKPCSKNFPIKVVICRNSWQCLVQAASVHWLKNWCWKTLSKVQSQR